MSARIKLCGLRTKEAVEAAIALGANYVGLVFFPASPRHVNMDEAAALAAAARGRVAVVAVTVDADDAFLETLMARVQPDYIQAHGSESPARVAEIRARYAPVIKAISVRTAADVARATEYVRAADMLLFDAKAEGGLQTAASSLPPPLAGGMGGNYGQSPKGLFGHHSTTTRNRDFTSHAKAMRTHMTDAEWKLWEYLSGKKLEGYKFRRQQSIGEYIVDFVCMRHKLVIEVDGGQHAEARAGYDAKRSAFLSNAGYRVLRFWNHEVIENVEGVVETILRALKEGFPPSPPVSGGGKVEATSGGDDHRGQDLPGGTGKTFDWSLLTPASVSTLRLPQGYVWLLSGGLHAGNVAEALRLTHAAGVDVSSGIESAPGVKDLARMREFVEAVRHA